MAKIGGKISSSVKLALVSLASSFNKKEISCVKKTGVKTPTDRRRKAVCIYGRGIQLGTAEKELDLVVVKALEPQADHNLFVWQLLLLKSVIVQLGTRHVPIALGTFEFGALLSTFLTCEQNLRILRFFGNI